MKHVLMLFCFLPCVLFAQVKQSLTLQQVYDLSQQNYPLVKQRELLKQTANINIDNLSKGFLPQFSISGQATYQSDVTEIKIPIPGVNITPLSKDQYKVLADVNQLIYDGGIIKDQKNIQQLNDNIKSTGLILSREDLEKIDKVSPLPLQYPGWMVKQQSSYRN